MSAKGLRYASIDALPPGLREQARKQFEGIRAPVDPVSHAALRAPIEAAKNAAASALVHNLGHNPGVIPKRVNKYGAVATVVDGIRFDSKREARYYEALKVRVATGEVRYFLRQVPLHLPGGTRLVIDFLEVHADGSLHYIDVKGRETPAFKIKRREIQAVYPIRVECV